MSHHLALRFFATALMLLLSSSAIVPAVAQREPLVPIKLSAYQTPAVQVAANLDVVFSEAAKRFAFDRPTALFIHDTASTADQALPQITIGALLPSKAAMTSTSEPTMLLTIQAKRAMTFDSPSLVDTGLITLRYQLAADGNTGMLLLDLAKQTTKEVDLGCPDAQVFPKQSSQFGLMYSCRVQGKTILTLVAWRNLQTVRQFEQDSGFQQTDLFLNEKLDGYTVFSQSEKNLGTLKTTWVCEWQIIATTEPTCRQMNFGNAWIVADADFSENRIFLTRRIGARLEVATLSDDCLRVGMNTCRPEPMRSVNKALAKIKITVALVRQPSDGRLWIWSCPLCSPFVAQMSASDSSVRVVIDTKVLKRLNITQHDIVVTKLQKHGSATLIALDRAGLPVMDRYIAFISVRGVVESVLAVPKHWHLI